MNKQVVRLDAAVHRTVQELLPWLPGDTLSASEQAMAHAHLDACGLCRADLAWQDALRGHPPEDGPLPDVEAGLRRTLARLDPPARPAWQRWRARLAAHWLRPALAAQFAVIAALAFQLADPARAPAAYRTLGPDGGAGNALVIFRPDTTESALRGALQAHGARIVAGPTAAGAYVLAVPTPAALAALRREPAVALAEPLGARP